MVDRLRKPPTPKPAPNFEEQAAAADELALKLEALSPEVEDIPDFLRRKKDV